MRRVCSRADEALRDQFGLAGWVLRPNARRQIYFGWCERASRDLTLLTAGSAAPKHKSVVMMLAIALEEDPSFAQFVQRRGRGASFITEDANWDKLYRACAATILEHYFDAVENGRWP